MGADLSVRRAREDDVGAVAAFTADTWDEFERGDYVPDVFPEWVATDGPDQHTVVAEREGTVVGCCQVVRLSAHESWTQGMRVHPAHRGTGVARALDRACRDWARDRGATVVRNMVFSWNEQGLAAARAVGYRPRAEFRWAHPEPDPDPAPDANPGSRSNGAEDPVADARAADSLTVTSDPNAVWGYWQRSDARDALGGLALDPGESWALSEWTAERTRRAAEAETVIAVQDAATRGATWRTRVSERDGPDGTERWAEYGAAAWDGLGAAGALFAAVRRDAAAVDADRARVLVPETPRHVSAAAAAGVDVGEHPDFVFEFDVSAPGD